MTQALILLLLGHMHHGMLKGKSQCPTHCWQACAVCAEHKMNVMLAVKSSWAAVASVSAAAQTGPVRRRQPPTAAQAGTPLQVCRVLHL
jgi:hypothetical protein